MRSNAEIPVKMGVREKSRAAGPGHGSRGHRQEVFTLILSSFTDTYRLRFGPENFHFHDYDSFKERCSRFSIRLIRLR